MKKLITAEAIQQYAVASKDMADIHLDAKVASRSGFERPIVHGMYIMGLAQSLYITEHRAQWITTYDMTFQKPLFVDSAVTFDYEVCDGNIQVSVTAETGEVIAKGTFSVKER